MKDWSVVTRNLGEIYCWNDQEMGPEYGPFRVLSFFKELQKALLCLGG